jgi:hypothetical protein
MFPFFKRRNYEKLNIRVGDERREVRGSEEKGEVSGIEA